MKALLTGIYSLWPARTRQEPTATVADRSLGSLLGLAVGDALGSTLEFSKRDATPSHTEMVGGGPYHLLPGHWTDDTAMALCLAHSLITYPKLNPCDLITRFADWRDHGYMSCTGSCFDIGQTVSSAISTFRATGQPIAGNTSPDTAGNGSIMRLAPAVLSNLHSEARACKSAILQGQTTHGAADCVDACRLLAIILFRAIMRPDNTRPQLTLPQWRGTSKSVSTVAHGAWIGLPRTEIRSKAYVVDTLEAAMWSVHSTDDFESALIKAVNLGGDADTIGAVTGQIAGATYGLSAIPERWLSRLAWKEEIEDLGRQLIGSKLKVVNPS